MIAFAIRVWFTRRPRKQPLTKVRGFMVRHRYIPAVYGAGCPAGKLGNPRYCAPRGTWAQKVCLVIVSEIEAVALEATGSRAQLGAPLLTEVRSFRAIEVL